MKKLSHGVYLLQPVPDLICDLFWMVIQFSKEDTLAVFFCPNTDIGWIHWQSRLDDLHHRLFLPVDRLVWWPSFVRSLLVFSARLFSRVENKPDIAFSEAWGLRISSLLPSLPRSWLRRRSFLKSLRTRWLAFRHWCWGLKSWSWWDAFQMVALCMDIGDLQMLRERTGLDTTAFFFFFFLRRAIITVQREVFTHTQQANIN